LRTSGLQPEAYFGCRCDARRRLCTEPKKASSLKNRLLA